MSVPPHDEHLEALMELFEPVPGLCPHCDGWVVRDWIGTAPASPRIEWRDARPPIPVRACWRCNTVEVDRAAIHSAAAAA